MSTHSTTHTNRLAGESSPYLLLHQHNPVDWHPWGPEALEKARREVIAARRSVARARASSGAWIG